MGKKFFVSLAAVAALATSAMAYNVSELKFMNHTDINATDFNKTIGFNQKQTANALIFPAYFVGNGWESTIRVINTDSREGIVAKVVLYDGKDSHEVRDFNIYLSPNDVWVGKIKVDSDGVAKIISTDDSTPLENGGLADTNHPFAKSIDSNFGYIEVIAMASTITNNNPILRNGHNDHAGLRKAYAKYAKAQRGVQQNPIFKNGVITNGASLPYVKINDVENKSWFDITGDGEADYNFTAPGRVLTGDIRITDTVNGKDMDMMAYKIDYNTSVDSKPAALIYLEGEKANLADVFIDGNTTSPTYNFQDLQTAIGNISSTQYYITYGDAPVNNMYAILTNPFKRVYVQAGLNGSKNMPNGALYYKDASRDANGNINYGSTSLIAQIFDESENMMSAGQFSPATTPTIKLTNEVATTGYDVNDKNTLAYYLNQAQAKGFERGFVILSNANTNANNKNKIPGIMTQMLATKAGDRVVTNWIIPQGND